MYAGEGSDIHILARKDGMVAGMALHAGKDYNARLNNAALLDLVLYRRSLAASWPPSPHLLRPRPLFPQLIGAVALLALPSSWTGIASWIHLPFFGIR